MLDGSWEGDMPIVLVSRGQGKRTFGNSSLA